MLRNSFIAYGENTAVNVFVPVYVPVAVPLGTVKPQYVLRESLPSFSQRKTGEGRGGGGRRER